MPPRTLIIAEAGVNHNGDIDVAYKLIDEAVAVGADVIKFQSFTADAIVTRSAKKAEYQSSNLQDDENQYEMLKRLEISESDHYDLKDYCIKKNITFLSTAFDLKSAELLNKLGLELFKIPSGEITNLPYLKYLGSLKKQIILSTGLSTLSEVGDALNILRSAGTSKESIHVLHCTSEYPAPKEEVNLKAMLTIRDTFNIGFGYSDHTQGIEVPVAAVALGAQIIEKHFTLDKNLPGPDHSASLEPLEFKAMVQAIRNIELALGDGIKDVSASELKNKDVVRKSIVASKNVSKGDLFSEDNLTAKRPGTGISPMRWDEIIGMVASHDFQKDDLIEL
jgi:N,N'-diacetyllegionaminate synthase